MFSYRLYGSKTAGVDGEPIWRSETLFKQAGIFRVNTPARVTKLISQPSKILHLLNNNWIESQLLPYKHKRKTSFVKWASSKQILMQINQPCIRNLEGLHIQNFEHKNNILITVKHFV